MKPWPFERWSSQQQEAQDELKRYEITSGSINQEWVSV